MKIAKDLSQVILDTGLPHASLDIEEGFPVIILHERKAYIIFNRVRTAGQEEEKK